MTRHRLGGLFALIVAVVLATAILAMTPVAATAATFQGGSDSFLSQLQNHNVKAVTINTTRQDSSR